MTDDELLAAIKGALLYDAYGEFSNLPDIAAVHIEALIAERDEARAEVARLRAALQDIANSDDIENALDPERNKRVARTALATEGTPIEKCPTCDGHGQTWTGEDVRVCPECKGNTVVPAETTP